MVLSEARGLDCCVWGVAIPGIPAVMTPFVNRLLPWSFLDGR